MRGLTKWRKRWRKNYENKKEKHKDLLGTKYHMIIAAAIEYGLVVQRTIAGISQNSSE